MKIDSEFDSGSIEVISIHRADDIQLALKTDNQSCNRQWFHFRLTSQAGMEHKLKIVNAGTSSFAHSWQGYQAVASFDGEHWFRVPTHYDGQQLVITHTPEYAEISYAYFPPYSQARQQQFIVSSLSLGRCRRSSLGVTELGHSIDMLTLGDELPGKQRVWVIARQHPGETMAQWFTEGLITGLLSQDATAVALLESAVFYIVPNMNPDGALLGNHRTNAQGMNLNRRWHQASAKECLEVYAVAQAISQKGVDLFLDVHGDEDIPHSFIMGGNASVLRQRQADFFKRRFMQAHDQFQLQHDYASYQTTGGSSCCGSGCGTQALPSKATDYVDREFGCLSLLLEMPFKVVMDHEARGKHNPQQVCIELGAAIMHPIRDTLALIKGEI
jgi:murein tripeptide amidase MpaA